MAKSRNFSIYLLKQGFIPANALKEEHNLAAENATRIPEGAKLYILNSEPVPPWWHSYFGVQKPLKQVHKGALIFIPVQNRHFAISFGHVAHNLKDIAYEYDFGLKVTLNSVDPLKLRSTDTLEPGPARRQRTQVPTNSDLTYFDFDRDSNVLRSLTGKVKDRYRDLFKSATGASNLRVSSSVAPSDLVGLCEKLLQLYDSDDYKATFPEIQNVSPVRDPVLLSTLDQALLAKTKSRDDAIFVTVPEILDYHDSAYFAFGGAGTSNLHDDVNMASYYGYLEDRGFDLNQLTVDNLHRHRLILTDGDGIEKNSYSIYRSLIFDCDVNDDHYHFSDAHWYRIEKDYIVKMKSFLDPYCQPVDLPDFTQETEGLYNQAVPTSHSIYSCLDTTNISLAGQTQVEPCDLISTDSGKVVFTHVKISTLSAQLSHLFNQGVNAVRLVRVEQEAREKLERLVAERCDSARAATITSCIRSNAHHVIYAIISKKAPGSKSANLPLFSRMSLMRCIKELRSMGVGAVYGFVKDRSPTITRARTPRRRRAS